MASYNILICGGSGFMGSHFIRHLYTKYPDYSITNLDALTYAGNPENLQDIVDTDTGSKNPRYTFIKGNICDRERVREVLTETKYDAVLNFAAESHVDRSIIDAMEFVQTNIQGAYALLEEARQQHIPRFVYISTDEVYGDIPRGKRSGEDYSIQPTNPYAASKASADLIMQSFMKTHKTPLSIVRSTNNYGSHQYPEKLHPLIITNLLEGRPIPVHGRGDHIRSWLHVSDFCEGVDLVLHKGKVQEIYNVGGEERTNLEVIEAIAGILKKDPSDYIKYISDRPAPDFRYSVDDSKIQSQLGWKRKQKYEKALVELVTWYRDNEEWWQNVRSKTDFVDQYSVQSVGYQSYVKPGGGSKRI